MSKRGTGVILGLGLMAAACGSDTRIVDQYFGAVNAGDNQTLTSFAMVPFKEKVEKWSVTGSSPERPVAPPPCPTSWPRARSSRLTWPPTRRKRAPIRSPTPTSTTGTWRRRARAPRSPANLQKFDDDWGKFEQNDKDLKKQIAENKAAVEKERRNVQLSVGQNDALDTMTGEMVEKTLDLALTIKGQVKNYAMGLRKYDLTGGAEHGPRGEPLGGADPPAEVASFVRPQDVRGTDRLAAHSWPTSARRDLPFGAATTARLAVRRTRARPAPARRSGPLASWRPPPQTRR